MSTNRSLEDTGENGVFGGKDRELLIRLDERTRTLLSQMLSYEKNYVTKNEFEPVKKMVFGVAALVLTAVVGAVVGLVIVP